MVIIFKETSILMTIRYNNEFVKLLCNTEKAAKKFFHNMRYYEDLQSVINLIEQSPTLSDLIAFPHLHFHSTDFFKKHSYGLDIGGRKSQYRLIVIPLDDNDNIIVKDEDFYKRCKSIRVLSIEEVSKHYE